MESMTVRNDLGAIRKAAVLLSFVLFFFLRKLSFVLGPEEKFIIFSSFGVRFDFNSSSVRSIRLFCQFDSNSVQYFFNKLVRVRFVIIRYVFI
jgi:hypothetical protein